MALPDKHRDLQFSKRAEQQFLERYAPFIVNNTAETSKDNKWSEPDFHIIGSPITVELKADRYTSGNLFIERYSNLEKKTDGGIWKSQSQGVRYLAYWLVKSGTWFLFDIEVLLLYLESIDLQPYEKIVSKNNKGYVSMGYAIPIQMLKEVALGEYKLEFQE